MVLPPKWIARADVMPTRASIKFERRIFDFIDVEWKAKFEK